MKIQLFVTCLVDAVHPEIGEAMVAVLENLGMSINFPSGQTCCGQPGYNSGYHHETRPVVLRFLDTFDNTEGVIVTPSGSCASMIQHGFPDLLSDDPTNLARAESIAKRTYELSQFLVHLLGVTNLGAHFDGKLTYHPSCHLLRGLGEKQAPLELLQQVDGARVVPLPNAEECCGFGGLFSIKMSPLSSEIASRKTANIAASGADVCVTCDAGCLMNIKGRLAHEGRQAQCMHLSQVLARQLVP